MSDYHPIFLATCAELPLSTRPSRCLHNHNIVYIGDLVEKTEKYLLKNVENLGRKSVQEIQEVLAGLGLRLGMKIDNWPPENDIPETPLGNLKYEAKENHTPQTEVDVMSDDLKSLLTPAQEAALVYASYKFQDVPEQFASEICEGVINVSNPEYSKLRIIDLHATYLSLAGKSPKALVLRTRPNTQSPQTQRFAIAILDVNITDQVRKEITYRNISGNGMQALENGFSIIEGWGEMFLFTKASFLKLPRPEFEAPKIIPTPAPEGGNS